MEQFLYQLLVGTYTARLNIYKQKVIVRIWALKQFQVSVLDTTMVLILLFSGQSCCPSSSNLESGVTAGPCNSFLSMQPKL